MFLLCWVVSLSVAMTVAQNIRTEAEGCNVISCLSPVKCEQLEQCLLVAQNDGCNPELIKYSAFEAYKRCLFGHEVFCNLSPLIKCYEAHLEEHTKTRLPQSTSLDPVSLSRFTQILLVDASSPALGKTLCSVPVSEVQKMIQCVLATSGAIEENCATAMPIVTKRYFSKQNLKATLNPSINSLLGELANYSSICSSVGQWTRWYNDQHPSRNNGSDIEIIHNPCGNAPPKDIECEVDDKERQLCRVDSCTESPKYECSSRNQGAGVVCRSADQALAITGYRCPCCDYKVRYLCPAADIITVYPTYGPEEGNSSMTIIGGALNSANIVLIGETRCPITERSFGRIVCTVPPLGLVQQGTRSVVVRTNHSIPNNPTYSYRGSVRVNKVYNLDTLVSGSTNVNLEGVGFLSISQPVMTITVYYEFNGVLRTWVFQSTCTPLSDVRMTCPVPPLINPIEFIPNATRLTTTPTPVPKSPVGNMDPLGDGPILQLVARPRFPLRRRRSVCDAGESMSQINDNDKLLYEATFTFNGQRAGGGYAMDVYEDPQIEGFKENPSCRLFRPWLTTHRIIEIQGNRLNNRLGCQTYNVRIGKGVCVIENLFSNQIICRPPEERPRLSDEDTEGRLGVEVLVGNGNLKFFVGCLDYEENLLDNTLGRLGIIGGLVLLLLLVIGITICCWGCRKRTRPKPTQTE